MDRLGLPGLRNHALHHLVAVALDRCPRAISLKHRTTIVVAKLHHHEVARAEPLERPLPEAFGEIRAAAATTEGPVLHLNPRGVKMLCHNLPPAPEPAIPLPTTILHGRITNQDQPRPFGGWRGYFLFPFHRHGIHMPRPVQIGAEHDPLPIRSKGHVGLKVVVVVGEIDQPLCDHLPRHRWLATHLGRLESLRRPEERDPLPILPRPQKPLVRQGCLIGHTLWTTAVTGKHRAVAGNVVVHRPLVTGELIPHPLAADKVHACEPKLCRPRCLQVVPDPGSVSPKELMPGDLVGHLPAMQQPGLRLTEPDRPDTVELVP